MKTKILLFMILCLSSLCVMGFTDDPPQKKGKVQGTITRNSTRKTEPKKQQTTAPAKQNSGKKQSGKHPVNYDPILGTSTYIPKVKTYTVNGVSFDMVEVQGGTFRMGNTTEQGRDRRGEPIPKKVNVKSFYIGKFEVTQELWQAVMGSLPADNYKGWSEYKGKRKPVSFVSYNDCQTFISKLNALTGKRFRLPSEEEWEFAARGGTKSKGYRYSGGNNCDEVCWMRDNADYSCHDVGTKKPNELGIYDMSGNVSEWRNRIDKDEVMVYRGDAPGQLVVESSCYALGGSISCSYDLCTISSSSIPESLDSRFNTTGFRLAITE